MSKKAQKKTETKQEEQPAVMIDEDPTGDPWEVETDKQIAFMQDSIEKLVAINEELLNELDTVNRKIQTIQTQVNKNKTMIDGIMIDGSRADNPGLEVADDTKISEYRAPQVLNVNGQQVTK